MQYLAWLWSAPLRLLYNLTGRPVCRRGLRLIKGAMLCLLIFFSPFLVWVVLSLNRELIVFMANASWLSATVPGLFAAVGDHVNTPEFATGFNEAALGGLLTLVGVVVTVWYYHVIRIQEVTEKRLFVIDELLEELKKNRQVVRALMAGKEPGVVKPDEELSGPLFQTEAWHKLGADVVLLPRRLHMRLSVLYGCLRNCKTLLDCENHRATIDRIDDVISDLHQFRSRLSRSTMT